MPPLCLMSEATIPLVDSKSLLTLFGTRDQHLRKIRESLGVSISGRNDRIHIEGPDEAVAQATEVFEQLKELAEPLRHRLARGSLADARPGDRQALDDEHSPIELQFAGRPIRPRTAGQARYVSAIREHDLVFCIGPAGTGKTYLAVAMAVQALKQEIIRKIVLVRPAVEAGESLGFLPGDLQAKINPYLRPLLDALREMMDYDQIKRYTEQDLIEMIPLAYMRGRTLNEAFVILDEAQNTTVAQMKMFLTRMGLGTKMVVSGDTTQVDLPTHTRSGLIDAIAPAAGNRRLLPGDAEQRGHRAAPAGAGDRPRVRGRGAEEAALSAPAPGRYVERNSKADAIGAGGSAGTASRAARAHLGVPAARRRAAAAGAVRVDRSLALWVVTARLVDPAGLLSQLHAAAATSWPRCLSRRPTRTARARPSDRGPQRVSYVYEHDKEPLVQLRAALQNRVVIVAGAKSAGRARQEGLAGVLSRRRLGDADADARGTRTAVPAVSRRAGRRPSRWRSSSSRWPKRMAPLRAARADGKVAARAQRGQPARDRRACPRASPTSRRWSRSATC